MTTLPAESGGRGQKLFLAVWLLMLIAVATYFRIAGVGEYHLNADEILYKRMSQGQNLAEVVRFSLNETHPPLFQILLHYWMQLSDSDNFLRSFSLLFGLLLIPIYYCIGNLIAGRLAGMCVATLAAFSYGVLIESYLLRNYTCFLFFLSLSFYWLLRWRLMRDNRSLVLYGLFGLLACLTHFSGIIAMFTMALAQGLSLLQQRPESRPNQLLKWLVANAIVASIAAPVYLYWNPAIAFYQSGGATPALMFTAKMAMRAFLSPIFMFTYLLPYRGGNAYALILYGTIILLIARAAGNGTGLHFLLWLMLMAFLVQIGLYLSGTYHVRNLVPGTRNSLWLMPMVIPALGATLASFVKNEKIQLAASVALILGGALIYDPEARFLDAEYMIKQKDYNDLAHYLGSLGSEDIIITDRMTGFLLTSEQQFNPYSAMDKTAWSDSGNPKIISYGKTRMLFDISQPRFIRLQDMLDTLQSPLAAEALKKAGRLVFINTHWNSPVLDKMVECKPLSASVVTFPKEGGYVSTSLIILAQSSYERYLEPENGIARACFK